MTRLSSAFAVLLFLPSVAAAQTITGSPAVTAQYTDPATIERITLRLAGNARETWNTVLVRGEPPLTWGSVASFAILMSESFDMQLTEAETELVAKKFAERYRSSDASGRRMLASGWGEMLEEHASGDKEARLRVRSRLGESITAAAKEKIGWGIAVREAMDRRSQVVHQSSARRPDWAAATGFDNTMSVADLDASIEMLYFMWVAAGRNPEYVTLEEVAAIRDHFLQNFAMLPSDMQYALANAQKIYAGLRVIWYTANAGSRGNIARTFSKELDALGLPDPDAATSGQSAWSDAGGKSRGDLAAEMVQGLAGASYKSAW